MTMNTINACPYCHQQTGQLRAGKSQENQRYRCSHCQRRYVVSPKVTPYPEALRRQAAELHAGGKSIRKVAVELGLNHQTVANWIRAKSIEPPVMPSETIAPVISLPINEPKEKEGITRWKRPTIRDVAIQAGVSTSTVSNYLTKRGYVHADTRERIRSAMKELHYTPNALVRAIRQRRTYILGVMLFGLHALDQDVGGSLTPPLLAGINQAAIDAGYRVLLYPGWKDEVHRQPGLPFLEGHIDGLLWVAPEWNEPILEQVTHAGLPVVALLSRHVPEGAGFVNADNIGGTQQLVAYLVEKGHRRIAFIGPAHSSNFEDRLIGYRQGLQTCAIPYDPAIEIRFDADLRDQERYEKALDQCLGQPNPPTAIVAPNDGIADLIIRLLNVRGLRVPEDVAVTGFDDIPDATQQIAGGLTTLRQPFRLVGEQAVRNLLKRIAGAPATECQTVIPVEVVVRRTA